MSVQDSIECKHGKKFRDAISSANLNRDKSVRAYCYAIPSESSSVSAHTQVREYLCKGYDVEGRERKSKGVAI